MDATAVEVSVLTDAGPERVAAFSDGSRQLGDLHLMIGEGPGHDAAETRRPVLVDDLTDGAADRWPIYAAAATERGVHAVFTFPLQVGAARLGVMGVYRNRPGPLVRQALAQALAFADAALAALLDGQQAAGDGASADHLGGVLDHHAQVHQAEGMVMVQLGVSLAAAAARLRAHAFADDRRLEDVARDVVERRLTLEGDTQ